MAPMDGDPGVRRIHVDGVDLEYVDLGSGDAIVFSHGGSSDLRYWTPQRGAIASRYRFVAYSRRFHGGSSSAKTEESNSDEHTSDLVALIRQLQGSPVHLVGFSTPIALRATLREPALVRSLTIVEPNMPWLLENDQRNEAVLDWWRRENKRVHEEAGADPDRRAKLWFELVNNQGPGTFDNQTPAFRQMWLDNFGAPRPAAAAEPITRDHLGSISVPTLVVMGEYGMPYSRRIAETLAPCIPGGQLVDIPGVTHFMSYQEPKVFNDTLLTFLARD